VTEAEFIERFDRHLARMDTHMARGNELMGEVRGVMGEVRHEMALTREEVRRNRETHHNLRGFIRDIARRNEKVWREVMEGLSEVRADVRAQTAAILTVLDRLEGGASA
jgi:hypothetical protein